MPTTIRTTVNVLADVTFTATVGESGTPTCGPTGPTVAIESITLIAASDESLILTVQNAHLLLTDDELSVVEDSCLDAIETNSEDHELERAIERAEYLANR